MAAHRSPNQRLITVAPARGYRAGPRVGWGEARVPHDLRELHAHYTLGAHHGRQKLSELTEHIYQTGRSGTQCLYLLWRVAVWQVGPLRNVLEPVKRLSGETNEFYGVY